MIIIVADNFVEPKNINEFLELAAELVKETLKEEGCISYALHEDIHDNCHLTFIEEWEDSEVIQKHSNSKHFKEIVPLLGKLCNKPGVLNLYKELKLEK